MSTEVEQWLETRWLGLFTPTLVERGFTSLSAIQSASDSALQSLIAAFPKPGHQLKLRVLIEDLRAGKYTPGSGSSALEGSDDEYSDSEDDEPIGDLNSQQLELQRKQAELVAQQQNLFEAQQAQLRQAQLLAQKDSEVQQLATQQMAQQEELRKQQSAQEEALRAKLEADALNQVRQQAAVARRLSQMALSKIPALPTSGDSDSSDDEGSTPLSPTAKSALEESERLQQAELEKQRIASLQAQSKEVELQKQQQDEFNRQQAALLQKQQEELERAQQKSQPAAAASPPSAASPIGSAPAVSKPVNSALAARMANLNLGAAPGGGMPMGGRPGASPPGAASPIGTSLKDRMAALAGAGSGPGPMGARPTTSAAPGDSSKPTSGTSTPTGDDDPDEKAKRQAAFKAKLGGLGAINLFNPGAAPPPSIAAKLGGGDRHFRSDSEDLGTHISADDFEYELPLVTTILDPQRTGALEKRVTETEWRAVWCILKDDCFFWMKSTSDAQPTGVVVLSEPGLSMQLIDDTSLEINTRRKTYQFKAATAEEMAGWNSKLRVAKLLYTSGTAVSYAKKVRLTEDQIRARDQAAREQQANKMGSSPSGAAMGGIPMGGPMQPQASFSSPSGASPMMMMAQAAAGVRSSAMMGAPPVAARPSVSPASPSGASSPLTSASSPAPTAAAPITSASSTSTSPAPSTSDASSSPAPSAASSSSSSSPAPSSGGSRGSISKSGGLDPRVLRDILINGAIFTKYKRKRPKRRLIWCPPALDRIFWGEENKKVKGFMMVTDIRGVSDGCAGAKKDQNALTIISVSRTLDLEAPDLEQKTKWVQAVQMLIQLASSSK